MYCINMLYSPRVLLRKEILRQEFTPNYAFKVPTLTHNVQVQESTSIPCNENSDSFSDTESNTLFYLRTETLMESLYLNELESILQFLTLYILGSYFARGLRCRCSLG